MGSQNNQEVFPRESQIPRRLAHPRDQNPQRFDAWITLGREPLNRNFTASEGFALRQPIRFLALFLLGLFPLAAIAQTATLSTIYSLNAATDGTGPYAPLVQGPDGAFYGTTSQGGVDGYGTIFKVTSSGTYTVLYNYQGGEAGEGSLSGLTYASDGFFYGTCSGGTYEQGMVFKISPSGTFSALYSFTGGTDGGTPESGVVQASDGNFYGTTAWGGAPIGQSGTIYKITPDGVLTTIYTFTGFYADGGTPFAGLVEGSDGNFYGTTNQNETFYGVGTVFKVTPSGTLTTLHYFQGGNDGGNPDGGLVEGADGNFYGSTHNYGLYHDDDDDTGQGVLYKVSPDGSTFKTLYEFTGNADSGRPEGTLALGTDGDFYGTTTNSPKGTLFQLTPSGTLTTLQPLSSTGYAEALSGPILGSEGDIYGTTNNGGLTSAGSIYQAVMTTALAPPVQLTLSSSSAVLGSSATLSWQVPNAFSNTSRRCIATVQNGLTAGGTWSGVQTGTFANGVYSGSATLTPTASGSYTYALTCGGSVSGFATLTVPPLTLPATTLPDGRVGTAYTASLVESNGLAPFTWTVASGTLPAGLTLDASTGAITGNPTQSGTSSFTVQVLDSESTPATASATLTLTVATAAPTLGATSATLSIPSPGASASTVLTLSGFASSAFNLSCSGLPAKVQCVFGAVSGTQSYATVPLQITTEGSGQAKLERPAGDRTPTYTLLLPGMLLLVGVAGARNRSRSMRLFALMLLLLSSGAALSGCGGGSSKTYSTPAGPSTVTVTAVAGDQSATTTITLTVQ